MRPKVIIPLFTFFAFFIFFFCLSLYRYNALQLFHYDFGFFASILWQLSRGHAAIINHISLGTIPFLGDHFWPGLPLLSPLFWIVKDLRILLLEQAFVTAGTGWVIYLLAIRKQLDWKISLVISVMYLIFAGIENPLVTDWHTESTAGLFLVLFVFFFLYGRRYLAVLSALMFVGLKESNALTFSFLAFSYFLALPDRRKELAAYLVGSITWLVATTKIIIPSLSHHTYLYSPSLPSNIEQAKESLINPAKYTFVWQSFLSFGYLPLFGKLMLIPILGEILIRILPLQSAFETYTLTMHYNVFLGIFLTLASIEGFIYLKSKVKLNQFALGLIFLAFGLFVAKKVTISPIVLATNKVFWQNFNKPSSAFSDLANVPKEGSIAAQNNLLSYLVLRNGQVYLINKRLVDEKPDTIVFDLSPDQNPNNFFPDGYDFIVKISKNLESNNSYRRIKTANQNFYIYTKR